MFRSVRCLILLVKEKTVEDARKNLIEAPELFFETAGSTEVRSRLHGEVFVTNLE